MPTKSLEHDLVQSVDLCARVREDHTFAQELYAALCNNQFLHVSASTDTDYWTCTWRYAADLIGTMRGDGADDMYSSGHEGHVSERVCDALSQLGWVHGPIMIPS